MKSQIKFNKAGKNLFQDPLKMITFLKKNDIKFLIRKSKYFFKQNNLKYKLKETIINKEDSLLQLFLENDETKSNIIQIRFKKEDCIDVSFLGENSLILFRKLTSLQNWRKLVLFQVSKDLKSFGLEDFQDFLEYEDKDEIRDLFSKEINKNKKNRIKLYDNDHKSYFEVNTDSGEIFCNSIGINKNIITSKNKVEILVPDFLLKKLFKNSILQFDFGGYYYEDIIEGLNVENEDDFYSDIQKHFNLTSFENMNIEKAVSIDHDFDIVEKEIEIGEVKIKSKIPVPKRMKEKKENMPLTGVLDFDTDFFYEDGIEVEKESSVFSNMFDQDSEDYSDLVLKKMKEKTEIVLKIDESFFVIIKKTSLLSNLYFGSKKKESASLFISGSFDENQIYEIYEKVCFKLNSITYSNKHKLKMVDISKKIQRDFLPLNCFNQSVQSNNQKIRFFYLYRIIEFFTEKQKLLNNYSFLNKDECKKILKERGMTGKHARNMIKSQESCDFVSFFFFLTKNKNMDFEKIKEFIKKTNLLKIENFVWYFYRARNDFFHFKDKRISISDTISNDIIDESKYEELSDALEFISLYVISIYSED